MLTPALPIEDGERVVSIQYSSVATGDAERRVLHDFAAWREELVSIEQLGAFRTRQLNLVTSSTPPEPIKVAEITASGFAVARTAPLVGRLAHAWFKRPHDRHEHAHELVRVDRLDHVTDKAGSNRAFAV